MWNVKKHSKKENETYLNARADEWTSLPIYATEIIIPPLMYFIKLYYVIIAVFVLNIIWGFFNRKFINIRISHILWEINKVRWIVFIVFGGFYISKTMYVEAVLSFIWPFIALILALPNFIRGYNKEIRAKYEELLYSKQKNN
jgi:hypothetical protein